MPTVPLFMLLLFPLSIFKLKKNQLILIYLFTAVILIIYAGTRNGSIFPDYENYELKFRQMDVRSGTEPSFYLISYIALFFGGSSIILFLTYAFLGVLLKFKAMWAISNEKLLCVCIYFSRYFFLNEMVQMRAGVASGFLLLSMIYIYKKDFYTFLFLWLLACFFHYSCLIFFPFYFLNVKEFDEKKYVFVFLCCFLVFHFRIDILSIVSFINIGEFIQRFDVYLSEDNAIYSMFPITRYVCVIIVLLFRERIALYNQYVYVVLKISFIGLCVLPLLYQLPAIATRLSELLGVFEIFLISFLIYSVKPLWIGKTLVLSYCAFILFLTYNGLKI